MAEKNTSRSKLKSKKKEKSYKEIKKKRVKVLSDEFYDFMGSGQWNATQPFLKKVAWRMRYWVENYHVITISEFCADHGISGQQLRDDWLPKSKELREAYGWTMEVIGTRREIAGLNKEMDSSIVSRKLNTYSYIYKQEAIEAKKIDAAIQAKAKADQDSGPRTLIIQQIPNTDVPHAPVYDDQPKGLDEPRSGDTNPS